MGKNIVIRDNVDYEVSIGGRYPLCGIVFSEAGEYVAVYECRVNDGFLKGYAYYRRGSMCISLLLQCLITIDIEHCSYEDDSRLINEINILGKEIKKIKEAYSIYKQEKKN